MSFALVRDHTSFVPEHAIPTINGQVKTIHFPTNNSLGPNELVIVDPIAHMVIDGPNNTCSKADWYDVVQPNTSVLFTRNQSMHDQRRRIWLKVLSAKGITII